MERDPRVCLEFKGKELQENFPIWSPVTTIAPFSEDRNKHTWKRKWKGEKVKWSPWQPLYFYLLQIWGGSPVWRINKTLLGPQEASHSCWGELSLFKSDSGLEERCVLGASAAPQQAAFLRNSAKCWASATLLHRSFLHLFPIWIVLSQVEQREELLFTH